MKRLLSTRIDAFGNYLTVEAYTDPLSSTSANPSVTCERERERETNLKQGKTVEAKR